MERVESSTATGESSVIISAIASVVIAAVDGEKTLLKFGFEFDYNGGPHLSDWGADIADKPTKETKAIVFEFEDNLTFARMSGLFSHDLSALCFTKNQIGVLLESNPFLVRCDAPLFFLFRNNGHFFVVKALAADTTRIKIFRFEDRCEWLGRLKPRLVIPG